MEKARTNNGNPHGKVREKLPRHPLLRMLVGFVLVAGGLLGFLPILGFWMVPLGLLVLSYDIAWVRRLRRRLVVWWRRLRQHSAFNRSEHR